tara:strand:- start:1268 stop:1870 length:603 start_codon:yes stop_codon:yes gene_type:complete
LEDAIEWVLSGGCIVYPTSTLPALGCIPNSNSLDRLYAIKGRYSGAPVSLGVVSLNQANEIVHVPDDVHEILNQFPEGSLTIILRARNELDTRLGGDKVAVRVLSNRTAKELLSMTGPLTATSANISGQESLLDCVEAAKSLRTVGEEVVGVDGVCEGGAPSTLIAWHTVCDSPESLSIEVIREGKVSSEEVLSWWKSRT